MAADGFVDKTVDVIVPVHNGPEHFVPCLRSLVRWTPDDLCNIHVADDASDSLSQEALNRLRVAAERSGRTLEITRSEQNLGFLRTCNAAMQRTSGEFVLLLNSDTVLTPGWLEGMLRCAHSDPRIALVNPLNNSSTVFAVGMPPGASFRSVAQTLADIPPRYPEICPATGFCLLVRRSALEDLGLFDEAFGNGWYEDIDFCMRAITSGWRAVVADNVYIYHRGEGSFDRTKGRGDLEKNRVLFESRWGEAYLGRLAEAESGGAVRHVTRLLAPGRLAALPIVLRHLPLVFLGHPRRALYRIRKDLASPARLLNVTARFLRRLALPDAPSLFFVVGKAFDQPDYVDFRRLVNSLILRDVDCRVLALEHQDDPAPRDSYFAPAMYTSAGKLVRSVPRAGLVCVLASPGSCASLSELADWASSSPAPVIATDLADMLEKQCGSAKILKGADGGFRRQLLRALA